MSTTVIPMPGVEMVIRDDIGEPSLALTVYCTACSEVLIHREFDVRSPLDLLRLQSVAFAEALHAAKHECKVH